MIVQWSRNEETAKETPEGHRPFFQPKCALRPGSCREPREIRGAADAGDALGGTSHGLARIPSPGRRTPQSPPVPRFPSPRFYRRQPSCSSAPDRAGRPIRDASVPYQTQWRKAGASVRLSPRKPRTVRAAIGPARTGGWPAPSASPAASACSTRRSRPGWSRP